MGEPDQRLTSETLREMIRNQWQDIHHSRSQDWHFWVVLGAIIAGVASAATSKDGDSPGRLLDVLLALGAFVAAIAATMAWKHMDLRLRKTAHMTWMKGYLAEQLEQSLGPSVKRGIPYRTTLRRKFQEKLFVSLIIFCAYFTLMVDFVAALIVAAIVQSNCSCILDSISPWVYECQGLLILGFSSVVFLLSHMSAGKLTKRNRDKYIEYFTNDK